MTEEEKNAKDALRSLITEARRTGLEPEDLLFTSGYRLDPYPNGKSKVDLIRMIDEREALIARARNLLRKASSMLSTKGVDTGEFESFLDETSTVKP